MLMYLTYSTYKNDVGYVNKFSVMLQTTWKCLIIQLKTMHHNNIIVIQVLYII
jgi:hypothetical protein